VWKNGAQNRHWGKIEKQQKDQDSKTRKVSLGRERWFTNGQIVLFFGRNLFSRRENTHGGSTADLQKDDQLGDCVKWPKTERPM